MTAETRRDPQAGFSLVEVMVAMVITVIISSAIYGLMAAGQGAFAREPQLTDRQQNARIAMDLIETDLLNAGRGLPLVAQSFTNALAGAGVVARAGQPNTDILEIIAADTCPTQIVCVPQLPLGFPADGSTQPVITHEPTVSNACLNPPGGGPADRLALFTNDRFFSVHQIMGGVAAATCSGAANSGSVVLGPAMLGFGSAPGGGPASWPAPPAGTPPTALYAGRVIRYRLTLVPDADGVFSLERSEFGAVVGLENWQVVARGIDNLDVQYLTGVAGPLPGGWSDTPGIIAPCVTTIPRCTPAEYATVVRNVRVTIGARVIAPQNLAGTQPYRADLTTVVTPRVATMALEQGTILN